MQATVYRCRQEGHKLEPDTIRATPARGELIVRRRGHFQRVALLTTPEGRNVIPVMGKVKILELNGQGVLLAGVEMLPGQGSRDDGPMYPQAWWCVLVGLGMVGRPGPTHEERRELERRRDAYAIGHAMTQASRRPGF